jgi:hypothetical protein
MSQTLAMTKLKNQLVKIDPDLKVELKNVRINGQLKGCTGFVTNPANGKIAYVSTDVDYRPGLHNALNRTAESTRDFRGGMNRFAGNDELPRAVVELLA